MSGEGNAWYHGLAAQGLTLSDVILGEIMPEGPAPINEDAFQSIKRAWLEFRTLCDDFDKPPSETDVRDLLVKLFSEGLGHTDGAEVQSANSDGSNISSRFKASVPGRNLLPDFVIRRGGSADRGRLLAMLLPPNIRMKGASRAGKAQRDLVLLLRHCRLEFGLLSNGHQIRLLRVTPEDVTWIQWDPSIWFEHDEGRKQLDGLSELLGKDGIGQESIETRREGGPDRFRLQDACAQSRQRQSSLSAVVGEGVRQSVEALVNQLNAAALTSPELLENILGDAAPRSDDERNALSSLHQASVRIVMRMIVILFAEARDLLPHRSSPVYRENYSLTRLLEQLEDANSTLGEESLNHTNQAWARILSLFDLIHDGSHHEAVSIHAYGGELFRPGDEDSSDKVLSALAAFEDQKAALTDSMVLEVLRKLRRSKMKANINGKSTWVATTVDYSTMDTEFIGMVYEGLLDYELRRVHKDDGAMVTLRIGQEPMLPLSLLEAQDAAQLGRLIKELNKKKETSAPDFDDKADEDEKGENEETAEVKEDDTPEDKHDAAAMRALEWALKAVEVGGLVKKPRGKKAAFVDMEELKRDRAEELLISVHAPGDMFLVSYSGNRKGSGTFYTPPGLTIPTVRRTLEPLCYDVEEEDTEDGLIRTLTPKTPQEILKLTVCDPAMGSGSFLVAALRYLTDALFTSLEHHGHFQKVKDGTRITLPAGTISTAEESEELLLHPDDARFEVECKARLKRYIAQRCIYGVDLNPMAVDLGKMALWVETLSRDLPFEFLDHHIKCGNSLVGAWFDEFEHFPLAAFARDTGDSGTKHASPVHHQRNTWRDLMRDHLKELKDPKSSISVAAMINTAGGQRNLFNYDEKDPMAERREALSNRRSGFDELQQLPLHDPMARELHYRELQDDPAFQELKLMMDAWCACWFWPPDQLRHAPTPSRFELINGRTRSIVEEISGQHCFFHWELEFPDVFTDYEGGFSAMIGNPPWDILKPNSNEFFSRYLPLWMTFEKSMKKKSMETLFEHSKEIEEYWISNMDVIASYSHFTRHRVDAFGDGIDGKVAISISGKKDSNRLREMWNLQRKNSSAFSNFTGYGLLYKGDVNYYKLFMEMGWNCIIQSGRIGFVTPNGLHGDDGCMMLRKEFIERGDWEWLFAFENREKIFDIDSRQKFCVAIIKKGGTTSTISLTFSQTSLNNWEYAEDVVLSYNPELNSQFSPETNIFIEVSNQKQVEILEKMYSSTNRIRATGENRWKLERIQNFDMTKEVDLYTNYTVARDNGYTENEFSILTCQEKNTLFPLFQGVMINNFEFNRALYVSGTGQSANWDKDVSAGRQLKPQYLVSFESIRSIRPWTFTPHLITRRLGGSTNRRSLISSVSVFPSGNSLATLFSQVDSHLLVGLNSVLNSLCFDFQWRMRLSGTNQSWTFLKDSFVPDPNSKLMRFIAHMGLRLVGTHPSFAGLWSLDNSYFDYYSSPTEVLCVDREIRTEASAMIEAIVAKQYGLSLEDLLFITKDCSYSIDSLRDSNLRRTLDQRGFWRIDSDLPAEFRLTNRVVYYYEMIGQKWENEGEESIQSTFLSILKEISRTKQNLPNLINLKSEEWIRLEKSWKEITGD